MSNGTGGPPAATIDGRGRPRGSSAQAGLPVGVVVLALVQVLLGASWLASLAGLQLVPGGMPQGLVSSGQPGTIVVWVLGLARLVAGVGLLTRLRAAWVLVMLLTGIGLASSIASFALGQPDDLRLLFEVISAFYLNQPLVRAAFGDRPQAPAADHWNQPGELPRAR